MNDEKKFNQRLVVSVEGLRKVYGKAPAIDGITFTVRHGEIFGLLGPNGAGKTTTLESLEGLRAPDSGKLEVMGINPVREPRKLRNLIGVQLQTSGLPDTMVVAEAMRFFSAYHGVKPRLDVLERLGLGDKMNAQYHTLSTGQRRRLTLALAVAHQPPVLILDEPTAGLDVLSRIELHKIMNESRSEGTTILLATHDMAEAEKLADRVAILLRGKIVATGTPRELTATGSGLTKISVRTENHSLVEVDAEFTAVSQHISKEEYDVYYSSNPGVTVPEIISCIEAKHDTLLDLRVERPSLEDRFLEITGTRIAT